MLLSCAGYGFSHATRGAFRPFKQVRRERGSRKHKGIRDQAQGWNSWYSRRALLCAGLPLIRDSMLKVIFACVHNAGRSQMAAAFFNQLADPQKARAISAGTEPAGRVHPEVQAVMQEMGIDLGQAKPQKLTEELARDAQLLITMGCGDECPCVPGLRRDDWPLRDPKGLPTEAVRTIRDEVKDRVNALITSEGLL